MLGAGEIETVPGQVFTAGGWRVRLELVKKENIRFNKINSTAPAHLKFPFLQGLCGLACKSGPSLRCGGHLDQHGVCVEGLSYSYCNECVGCSYNSLTCFEEDLDCWAWWGVETAITLS